MRPRTVVLVRICLAALLFSGAPMAVAETHSGSGITEPTSRDPQSRIAMYSNAIKLKPDDPLAYYNRGTEYLKIGDQAHGIADLSEAIRLRPDYAAALTNRGTAYHLSGENQRAVDDYTAAIKLQPNVAEAFNDRGNAYAGLNNFTQAFADFAEALRLRPDFAEAIYNRGLTYEKSRNFGLAIADYQETIRLKPDFPSAYLGLGLSHANLKDYAAALADLTKYINLEPSDGRGFRVRGQVYVRLGHRQEALNDYEEAIRLQPEDASALNSACWTRAAFLNTDFDRAEAECNKAVQLVPDKANYHGSRAMLALKQKRYHDAWNDYDAATKLDPKSASHWYGLAVAELRLGRVQDAQAHLAKARTLDSNIAQTYASYGIMP